MLATTIVSFPRPTVPVDRNTGGHRKALYLLAIRSAAWSIQGPRAEQGTQFV